MYLSTLEELRIDCEKCSGLCCVALYCSKIDGFPEDKQAGIPCKHLQSNFKCDMHSHLLKKNMKGCLTYECFGAGQRVTQMYAPTGNWSINSEQRKEIYEVFWIVTQLHQMRWYLIQALECKLSLETNREILLLIQENEQITNQETQELLKYNLVSYREKTNKVLKGIVQQTNESNKNFFGKNLKNKNLDGKDLSMALMIASNLENCSLRKTNFLGADMRDANIKNTDLSESLFLTQMQINSAKGNEMTKLPAYLSRPSSWS